MSEREMRERGEMEVRKRATELFLKMELPVYRDQGTETENAKYIAGHQEHCKNVKKWFGTREASVPRESARYWPVAKGHSQRNETCCGCYAQAWYECLLKAGWKN